MDYSIYFAQIEGTRGKQEDSVSWYEYPDGSGGCAIVADGIGGGGDGDKASKTVVAAFVEGLKLSGNDLKCALSHANTALLRAKERLLMSNSRSCGCTLVAVSIVHGRLSYISVGDSNIFLHKKGRHLGSHVNIHHSAGGSKITSAVTGYFELSEHPNPRYPNQKPFDYRENFAYFEPGDRLILASDGIDSYEHRKGSYERLSALLLQFPVGGEDVKTIVSHILNELELRMGQCMKMAHAQQWPEQKIKTIQDNATILMIEVPVPSVPIPHTIPVPPDSRRSDPEENHQKHFPETLGNGGSQPPFPPSRSAGKRRSLLSNKSAVIISLLAAIILSFCVILSFPGDDEKSIANVENATLESPNPQSKIDVGTPTGGGTGDGNSAPVNEIAGLNAQIASKNKEISSLQNQVTALTGDKEELLKQVKSIINELIINENDIPRLERCREIIGVQEDLKDLLNNRVLALLQPDNNTQFSMDFLKAIAQHKAVNLWENIVVPVIRTKHDQLWTLVPSGVKDVSWGTETDKAPDTWKLFRYIAELAGGKADGDMPNYSDALGGDVKRACETKLKENKKAAAKTALEAAANGADARALLDKYNAYLAYAPEEAKGIVKAWLMSEAKLDSKKIAACVNAKAEPFIALALEIIEARTSEIENEKSLQEIYKPIIEVLDFPSELNGQRYKTLINVPWRETNTGETNTGESLPADYCAWVTVVTSCAIVCINELNEQIKSSMLEKIQDYRERGAQSLNKYSNLSSIIGCFCQEKKIDTNKETQK